MNNNVVDNLDLLLRVLPADIRAFLPEEENLLEIVLDLGRRPEFRFSTCTIYMDSKIVTWADLNAVIVHLSTFGPDNRAGIEGTLHRISCIRNRAGTIVGLTCRVGRSVIGAVTILEDAIRSGKSILMLGSPGKGKSTKLREAARILSESNRVVIVDTSNEIGGDGDIAHPAIGLARRMQVPFTLEQHHVMIEAVENHMPQIIVIDEIGTESESAAARTIAERGVQLIATAHGNNLENLMVNPTLSDLIGGIAAVTLSDDEARKRGTQKTVLERKSPPTFGILVEILSINKVAIYWDLEVAVDRLLRGGLPKPEIRELNSQGKVLILQKEDLGSTTEDTEEVIMTTKKEEFEEHFIEKEVTIKQGYQKWRNNRSGLRRRPRHKR